MFLYQLLEPSQCISSLLPNVLSSLQKDPGERNEEPHMWAALGTGGSGQALCEHSSVPTMSTLSLQGCRVQGCTHRLWTGQHVAPEVPHAAWRQSPVSLDRRGV